LGKLKRHASLLQSNCDELEALLDNANSNSSSSSSSRRSGSGSGAAMSTGGNKNGSPAESAEETKKKVIDMQVLSCGFVLTVLCTAYWKLLRC
jgi:hypothetical protein